MGFLKLMVAALLGSALLIGSTNATLAKVSAKQIEKAMTVDELVALGAAKLNADQFKQMVVGKPMTSPGWTWIIDPNGTTSSSATDGSWKEDAAPWKMKGDAYCAKLDGKMVCRDVYLIGPFMRMSDKSNPAALSPWTVKIGK